MWINKVKRGIVPEAYKMVHWLLPRVTAEKQSMFYERHKSLRDTHTV